MKKRILLWSERGVILTTITLMILFFLIGTSASEGQFPEPRSAIGSAEAMTFFLKICRNNLVAASVILLGSISYCIISFSVVGYSSFTIGTVFMDFYRGHGMLDSLALIFAHGVIEMTWLVLLMVSAYDISNMLSNFLKNTSAFKGKRTYGRIALAFLLVIFGAFVEAFVSIPLYLYIMK